MAASRFVVSTIAALTLLSGCTSYRGPERLHSASTSSVAAKPTPARSLGFQQLFVQDLAVALKARSDGVSDAQRRVITTRLLNSGFALVRSNCLEYFNEMGRNQRNSRVLRDLLTPITTVINGLVGLGAFSSHENVNGDILTGFALATGAGASALNIYDNRFLFGSDNIASVSTMTLKALGSHQASVERNPPTDIVFALSHLQENEDICTPPQILTLVRESIKNSAPTTTGGGETTTVTDPTTQVQTEEPAPNQPRSVSVPPQ